MVLLGFGRGKRIPRACGLRSRANALLRPEIIIKYFAQRGVRRRRGVALEFCV
jgi:hypothetical protein